MISSFVRARPLARSQTQNSKLLIYGLFQEGRVLAQDGVMFFGLSGVFHRALTSAVSASPALFPKPQAPKQCDILLVAPVRASVRQCYGP